MEMASEDTERPRQGDARSTSGPTPRCTPAAGTPPRPRPGRSPPASTSRTASSTSRSRPCPVGSGDASSSRRILFSGAETLLLDEPTNHLDADSIVWLREFLRTPQGRAHRDQPRRGAARGVRQQGAPPRRQPGRGRRLQHGLVVVPHPARDRRAPPQARARQRRAQGDHADGPGQQDARQGHQGPGRAVDDEARREDDGRRRGGARRATRSRRSSSPSRPPAARRR